MGNLQSNNYVPVRYSDLRKKHGLQVSMSQFYLDHDIPTNGVTSFLIYREPLYFFDKNNDDKNGQKG